MKVITLFNPKGGSGKTFLTLEIAFALEILGAKVLLIDLDPRCFLTARLERLMGQQITEHPDILTPWIELVHTSKIRDDFFPYRLPERNIYVYRGRTILAKEETELLRDWEESLIGEGLKLRKFLDLYGLICEVYLKRGIDIALIDIPSSIGALSLAGVLAADEFFIPVTPDPDNVDVIKSMRLWFEAIQGNLEVMSNLYGFDIFDGIPSFRGLIEILPYPQGTGTSQYDQFYSKLMRLVEENVKRYILKREDNHNNRITRIQIPQEVSMKSMITGLPLVEVDEEDSVRPQLLELARLIYQD